MKLKLWFLARNGRTAETEQTQSSCRPLAMHPSGGALQDIEATPPECLDFKAEISTSKHFKVIA